MSKPCLHINADAEVVDQTLGVTCPDCEYQAACWMDEHVPESIWNKACKNTEGCKPCEQNRDDVCFLCGTKFTVTFEASS